MAVTSSAGSARLSSPATDSWKQLTVSAFLGRCRWSNAPGAGPAPSPELSLTLDYRLSVGQFFGAVPWQGSGLAQPSSPAELHPSLPSGLGGDRIETDELPDLSEIGEEDRGDGGEITLDDLLGAFG